MKIFLIRHGDAAPGIPDFARILTEKGVRQIESLAGRIDKGELEEIAAIEHSPFARAAATAGHLKHFAGLRPPLAECLHIRPDDDPRFTAAQLASGVRDRLLIGHNPHHEMLASLLLGQGKSSVQVAFGTGAALALERFAPASKSAPYGYWQLRWFLLP